MAEEEMSVAVHEHIEPNLGNLATIAAVVIAVMFTVKWLAARSPSLFGGLSAI